MRLELEKKQEKEAEKNKDWMENERLSQSKADYYKSSNNKTNVKYNNTNSGSFLRDFTNLHYEGGREDSLDLYTFREDGQEEGQRKEQSFQATTQQGFHFATDPRFTDNFPAYQNNQYYQGFAEFPPVFTGPYNNLYGTEFDSGQSSSSASQQPSAPTYEFENQYTNLHPIGSNKIESFSDFLNGRYNYSYDEQNFNNLNQTTESGDSSRSTTADKCNSPSETTNNTNNTEESDENFGEIIKKSMVETVSA